jgi:N-acetylneuraminate synthase/N,N'-diacetyllegionaminate synthase
MTEIVLGRRRIGPGHPCFIIAEAGVNHNGDIGLAERLVEAAAEAGADAVKFQTFTAERLATPGAPKADYQLATTGGVESQVEMLRKLELSREAHLRLIEYAGQRGIVFLSTPFDEQNADLLDNLGVPLFKIASGEITNLPLLEHVARKRKPMIVSTGMSTLDEVGEAVRVIQKATCPALALLHCTSNYPADPAESNLNAMMTMRQAFDVPVGYSDHTPGIEVAVAAVAVGASVLEKHLTLSRGMPGPDHRASLEPGEFKAMAQAVRTVEMALGDGVKRPMESERNTRAVARRSLVAAMDLPAGTVLEAHHVTAKRPGLGLPPSELAWLIGRKLSKPVRADDLISWSDVT